jgi:hypothetical protein
METLADGEPIVGHARRGMWAIWRAVGHRVFYPLAFRHQTWTNAFVEGASALDRPFNVGF